MSTVRCPVCLDQLDNSDYEAHMSLRHPDEKDWFRFPADYYADTSPVSEYGTMTKDLKATEEEDMN